MHVTTAEPLRSKLHDQKAERRGASPLDFLVSQSSRRTTFGSTRVAERAGT